MCLSRGERARRSGQALVVSAANWRRPRMVLSAEHCYHYTELRLLSRCKALCLFVCGRCRLLDVRRLWPFEWGPVDTCSWSCPTPISRSEAVAASQRMQTFDDSEKLQMRWGGGVGTACKWRWRSQPQFVHNATPLSDLMPETAP